MRSLISSFLMSRLVTKWTWLLRNSTLIILWASLYYVSRWPYKRFAIAAEIFGLMNAAECGVNRLLLGVSFKTICSGFELRSRGLCIFSLPMDLSVIVCSHEGTWRNPVASAVGFFNAWNSGNRSVTCFLFHQKKRRCNAEQISPSITQEH